MKGFYLGALAALGVLLYMTWHFSPKDHEVSSFYGIVDTAETVVSAEIPVEIARIAVVPGQVVRGGDTLATLSSSELERSIAELRHRLSEVRAIRMAADREIQAKVAELEARYNLNRSLLSQMRGVGEPEEREGASPLRAAITGLKSVLDRDEISTEEMEAYLELLLRERDRLVVLAPGSGVIGSVHRRPGEKVKAFEPVLTLHTGSPLTVRGYLHESVHDLIEPGRRVRVRSLASPYEVTGEVVGVGHRIIEYPLRLRKRPDILVWGREITVRIPAANAFLLGEKVIMLLEPSADGGRGSRSLFPASSAHAATPPAALPDWKLPGVEASGLVFLSDLGKFLVISDDTPRKKPLLHLVDAAGRIEGTLAIQGLDAINDMESIAQDAAGRLYVAASQSRNKAGKFPATRRLLVRVAREGTSLRLESSVSLFDALETALAGGKTAGDWTGWLRGAMRDGTLDMEGIAPLEGGLLLGFKSPLRGGRAVILHVHDADGLLAGKAIPPGGISLWAAPELVLPEVAVPAGISDMLLHEGVLHLLGTAAEEDGTGIVTGGGGGWWHLDSPGDNPRLLHAFPGEKPEGIAFDPVAGVFRIAFDNGASRPGRVIAVKVPAEASGK